jgi:hypothetical protein
MHIVVIVVVVVVVLVLGWFSICMLLYCRCCLPYVVSLYIIVGREVLHPTGLSQLQITNLLLFLC